MQWRIGCSGFHYKDWKGNFYPEKLPQSKWFVYYAEHFNTLELNVTFYRFPQLSFLQNWFNKSPADFSFSVKAPRLITHYKQFNECEQLLSDFYTTIREGLQQKLGAVLFQLPPKVMYSEEMLQRIITSVDTCFSNVIEFRHASWWQQQVYDTLAKHNITFCSISYPNLPKDVIANTPDVYYRFHGIPKLYYSEYSEATLHNVADALLQQYVQKASIYFNNTATMAAINNAREIKKYLNLNS